MSIKIGIGKLRITPATAAPAYDPFMSIINDGNTKAWYLGDQLSTITKDGSNRMSSWNDFLGSGHNLLQANGAKKPLWVTPGTVRFDGTDEDMKTAPFVFNQPCFIYLLFKQITWTNNDRIFDGNTAYIGNFVQLGTTPEVAISAGTALPAAPPYNANLPVNTWGIARILFNGANSRLQIDATAANIGNAGAGNMGGFTLGSLASEGTLFANIEVKEAILRNVIYNATDDAIIYNYLLARKP